MGILQGPIPLPCQPIYGCADFDTNCLLRCAGLATCYFVTSAAGILICGGVFGGLCVDFEDDNPTQVEDLCCESWEYLNACE